MKVKSPCHDNVQIYSPRGDIMPKRPKTKCSICGKDFDVLPNLAENAENAETTKKSQTLTEKEIQTPFSHHPSKTDLPKLPKLPRQRSRTPSKNREKIVEDQKLSNFIRSISGELIIALNYAINSIKNKPEVKEKKLGATRYDYFKNWSEYRAFFKKLDDELKRELKIIK